MLDGVGFLSVVFSSVFSFICIYLFANSVALHVCFEPHRWLTLAPSINQTSCGFQWYRVYCRVVFMCQRHRLCDFPMPYDASFAITCDDYDDDAANSKIDDEIMITTFNYRQIGPFHRHINQLQCDVLWLIIHNYLTLC